MHAALLLVWELKNALIPPVEKPTVPAGAPPANKKKKGKKGAAAAPVANVAPPAPPAAVPVQQGAGEEQEGGEAAVVRETIMRMRKMHNAYHLPVLTTLIGSLSKIDTGSWEKAHVYFTTGAYLILTSAILY